MSTPSLKDSLKLNTPRRTPDHKTKSHVVKINDNGTERMIRFGQQGVTTAGKPKAGESQTQKNRRSSFKARHKKNIDKGPTSAAYWANKEKWNEGGRVLGVTGDDPLTEAMTGTLGQFRTTQDRDPRTVTQETSRLADLNDDGRIDFYDGYEAVRPSYPSEIWGALKQAGSNISQGDIAPGAAMLGLSGLMLADYIPGAKFATSTIGRPIKSFLQDIAGNLPDTSVLEAASYKGRLRDALRGSKQKTMTPKQLEAELEGKVSQTEKRFIEPELENIRYQAKLQDMAGEKPNDTVTTEYLEKVLDRNEPGKSYSTKSGTTERYPTVLQEKEFTYRGVDQPLYDKTMRRPAGVFGDDSTYSDEYKEIVVSLTPEMKVQYQQELAKDGLDIIDVENVHYVNHPNSIFHMRTDLIRDELPDGNYKYVTFSEEFQSDTAIKLAKEGEYDQFTPLTLSTPKRPTSRTEELKINITEQMLKEDPFNTSKSSLKLSGLPTGTENIERGFKELPEKISRKDKAKLQNKIATEIEETKEKLENALYADPPTEQIPFESIQGTEYRTARRQQDDPYAIEEIKYKLQRLDAQRRLLNNVKTPEGVPKNFPFVKEWPKLAMQRLVNEGVGDGSDAIGWISGNQSASVRGATKHIEGFEYDPSNGVFKYSDPVKGKTYEDKVSIQGYSDRSVIGLRYGKEIESMIFDQSDGANEVVRYAFDKPMIKDTMVPSKSIDPLTGMRGEKNSATGPRTLYDNVMVKEAKKIGKKYGVEPYQSPNGDWRMDITPEMREDFMLDVTYAEGGAVELDLGMDERDYQRETTKEKSSLADYNNDGRIDSLDALAVGYDLIVPTDPRDIGSDASDALKLMLQQQYLPAAALGTAALLGGSEYVPGAQLLKGVTRPIRQALKKYDPNIVESRAEDIVKGIEGRGGRGPEVKSGQEEIDYSKRNKREIDPLGYQETKMDKPPDQVDVEQRTIVQLPPKKIIKIEDLEGKIAIPLYGDRSSLGKEISRVDDINLETPVITYGGRDYMRGDAIDVKGGPKRIPNDPNTAIWASGQAIIKRLITRAKEEAEKTGKEVVGVTGTMSPSALDFNTFTPELLAEMTAVTISRGGMKKKDMAKFDELMKTQVTKAKDFRPVEDWPGIDSPDLRDYIVNAPSRVRKKFMRIMEKADAQKASFPSPGKARVATTDESQIYTPPGMFGGAVAKIDLDAGPITDPLIPHPTYNTQMSGTNLGGLERDIPQAQFFPKLYKEREGTLVKGKPESESNKSATIRTQVPGQEITPEVVDTISASIEEMKKRGYKEGGQPRTSFFENLFEKFLGAQATGGLEISGGRDIIEIPYFDPTTEEVTMKTMSQDRIGGYASIGAIKTVPGIGVVIDGSVSIEGGASRTMDDKFQGDVQLGPITGGVTIPVNEGLDSFQARGTYRPSGGPVEGELSYQTPEGRIGFGGSYNKDSNDYNVGLNVTKNFAEGGVYNAKKIDMMSDQILEAYDV